jgi:hypothetical protein
MNRPLSKLDPMVYLQERFAKRIIIDARPSYFTFICEELNYHLAVPMFVYLQEEKSDPKLVEIGVNIPDLLVKEHNLHRIEIFEKNSSLSPKLRQDLLQTVLNFEIHRVYTGVSLRILKPIIFFLGSDRFLDFFSNPKDEFLEILTAAQAGRVIFDKTDL